MNDTANGDANPGPASEELPAPVQMTGLLAGFQIAQALYVVAKLGLATTLADGPRTIDELAAATGAMADPIRLLAASRSRGR